MDRLKLAFVAEAESLDRQAAEYEQILTGSPERLLPVLIFRGMAAAKRAAAATLSDSDGTR